MQCMTPFYTDFDPVEYSTFAQTETFRRFGKHQDVVYHTTHDFSNFGRKKLELKWIMHPTLNSVGENVNPFFFCLAYGSNAPAQCMKWPNLRVTILGLCRCGRMTSLSTEPTSTGQGTRAAHKTGTALSTQSLRSHCCPTRSVTPHTSWQPSCSAPPSTGLSEKNRVGPPQATFSMQGLATLAFAQFFEWWTGRSPPDRLVQLFKPFWIRSLNCKGPLPRSDVLDPAASV